MTALDLQKSIPSQHRPSRVIFFYFSPLCIQEQEVQDPENELNIANYQSSSPQLLKEIQHSVTKSQQDSWATPTNFGTGSGYNTFFNFSIELPKIKRRYLQDYIFLSNLGRGTYGRVQKLKSKTNNNIYAGKTLLKTPNASTNQYKNKKLQSEIKIYEKLNHPNIPQLYQIYKWKNQSTLILEYANGQNLHSLTKEKPSEEKKIARIMYQIFDVLEYLHALNIVHHDLKPENIIFDPMSEVVKIFDFGEAVLLKSQSETIQGLGGTFPYFAPECFNNICTKKLDVWACGVALFYLLSGKIFFFRQNKEEMKQNIFEKQIVFEGNYWNQRSENVKDLILKMLERDYSKRISATQAKNHPWIIENTIDWQNPTKSIVRTHLRTGRRSCSIDSQMKEKLERGIIQDMQGMQKISSRPKTSRFNQI